VQLSQSNTLVPMMYASCSVSQLWF